MKAPPDRSPSLLRPDLCIVGAGRAGLAFASGAAALGVSTVVIDARDLGVALPRAGETAFAVLRDIAAQALRTGCRDEADWEALTRAAVAAAQSRAPTMSATHLRAIGATVIEGTARFADPATIEAGGLSVQPRRIILATGVAPAVPALPGLDHVPWSSADRWTELKTYPKNLIVLGAGRTGVEMAQAFRRLGTAVTLVDGAEPLRGFDAELAAPVLTRLRREGIILRTARTVLRAEPREGGLRLVLATADGGEEALPGDHLLLATGWRPAIDALRLDRAGIRRGPDGIAAGPDGRTGNPRVFAIGDVAGRGRSIEAAEAQAGVALRAALFRQRVSFDPRSAPRILRTDPEIAAIGLTEPEARARHGRIHVWRCPYTQNGRALASSEITGHIKVLTTPSGRIVGAGIVGREAGEMIGLWMLAIARNLTIKDLAALPLPAEAYADLSRRVSVQGAIAGLDGPWLRRALKVVRWMG